MRGEEVGRTAPVRNWSIATKILIIPAIAALVMTGGVFAYLLPFLESKMMAEKQIATRHVVELAWGIVSDYDQQVKAGVLSLEEAKKLTAEYRVPVVVEVILERVTNISMGTELDNVVEFEDLAERREDAPTAVVALLD